MKITGIVETSLRVVTILIIIVSFQLNINFVKNFNKAITHNVHNQTALIVIIFKQKINSQNKLLYANISIKVYSMTLII